jgi:SAM-dependent methyltransferase
VPDVEFYQRSAPYYDLIYQSIVDYDLEETLLEALFERYAEGPIHRILDLGSGTGNHALRLASRGYEVVGVDRNEAFLAAAEAKTRSRENPPRFILGDMRDLALAERFDAIICMFGAFSHLGHAEAGDALAGFLDHLEPGGLIVYEWWNLRGAEDGYLDWLDQEKDGIRLIRLGESHVDAKAKTLEIAFKHLVLLGDRVKETFSERSALSLYAVEEMEELLSQVGLTPMAMLDWSRKVLEPHRPDAFRVLAVARRDR